MSTENQDNTPNNSREEILKQLLAAEAKIDAWSGRLAFDEQESDKAEAQLDADTASLLENSEDPALTKKLWHGAQSSIIGKISKGKLRAFALSEKGLFLRKTASSSDQKFSFKQANQVIWDIVDKWVRSNEAPFELGMSFWDLNEQFGYHKAKGSKPTAQP